MNLDIKDAAAGGLFQARSIDISRGGIGFFSPKFIPTGAHLRIGIHIFAGGKDHVTNVSATVMRATADTGGAIIGAAFDTLLSPAAQPLLCEYMDSR